MDLDIDIEIKAGAKAGAVTYAKRVRLMERIRDVLADEGLVGRVAMTLVRDGSGEITPEQANWVICSTCHGSPMAAAHCLRCGGAGTVRE